MEGLVTIRPFNKNGTMNINAVTEIVNSEEALRKCLHGRIEQMMYINNDQL